MLLLPDPLGPEIEIRPGSKSTVVFLKPNDLKPKISTLRMCTNAKNLQIREIIGY